MKAKEVENNDENDSFYDEQEIHKNYDNLCELDKESISYENDSLVNNKQKNVENAVNPHLRRYIPENQMKVRYCRNSNEYLTDENGVRYRQPAEYFNRKIMDNSYNENRSAFNNNDTIDNRMTFKNKDIIDNRMYFNKKDAMDNRMTFKNKDAIDNRMTSNEKFAMDNSDPREMGPVYGAEDRRIKIFIN